MSQLPVHAQPAAVLTERRREITKRAADLCRASRGAPTGPGVPPVLTLRAATSTICGKACAQSARPNTLRGRSDLTRPPITAPRGARGEPWPDAGSLGPGACLAPRCPTCRLDLQPVPGPSLSSGWPDRRDREDLEEATLDQACQQGGHPPVAVLTSRPSWPCPLACIPVANLHLSEPCLTELADLGGVQPSRLPIQRTHGPELPAVSRPSAILAQCHR